MAEEIKIDWGTTTAMTVTNLASLGADDIWQSGEINDAAPANQVCRISYLLIFTSTPSAGHSFVFRWAVGDEEATNEIWPGGIGTTIGTVTSAAATAEVRAGCPEVHRHAWITDHTTTLKGWFDVWNFGPSWQLLIEAVGTGISAGTQRVHRRYGTPQRQT